MSQPWEGNRYPGVEDRPLPNTMNIKRATPRHTVIKMAKVQNKERVLKVVRGKKESYTRGLDYQLTF